MPDLRRVTPTGLMVMSAKDMHADREGWLRLRRYREGVGYCIGSSDVPSILGIKDAGTALAVWHEKVHLIETPDNEAMFWGRMDEDTTARYWRDRNRSVTRTVGLIAAESTPWAQASLDRMVLECPLDRGVKCAVEVKHRGAFGSRRLHAEVPDDMLAQMCWQIFVSGYDHVHYAARIGGNVYKQGVVRAEDNREVIDFVVAEVTQFRSKHLAGRGAEVEPPWPIEDKAAHLIDLDSQLYPTRVGELEVAEIGEVMELAMLRRKAADAKAEADKQKARILQLAKGAELLTFAGEPAIMFKHTSRSKVDLDMLRENFPEAYEAAVSQTSSYTLEIAKPYVVKKAPKDPEE